jgi:ComF family protein
MLFKVFLWIGCNLRSSARPEAHKWANKALDLLFPPVCAACDTLGPLICDDCLAQMLKIYEPLCQRCGRSLLYAAPVCGKCMQPSFRLRQVRAPLAYEEPTARIIHRLKYEGLFALAKPLVQIMVASWPDWEINPDVIIPVPLHKQRRRRRGFNQSTLLAEHLGQKLAIPVDEKAMKRVKYTIPQIGLNPAERHENVRDAFAADSQKVNNKQILLIDDVYTTGATMSAAADSLLASGAAGVSAYCLARAVQ